MWRHEVIIVSSIYLFQSTHLHEVWHKGACILNQRLVSIHTPTWGVTKCQMISREYQSVSIHTPTWGVTSKISLQTRRKKFQSTHLHEVWLNIGSASSKVSAFQSTHLHEVWLYRRKIQIRRSSFNPHTYMRCDIWSVTNGLYHAVSIHTPTWGVTVIIKCHLFAFTFQSTHLHEVWLYAH